MANQLGFPVPVPKNGDDFDATPVGELFDYLLEQLQQYDAANIKAGTITKDAFDSNTNPLARYSDMFGSFITGGGLSSGFTGLQFTVPAITSAFFSSTGERILNINGGTYTVPISSDTYVSVNSNGAINTPQSVSNNSAQPALPSANSQWLQRVVSNGSVITRIDDLRNLTPFIAKQQAWIQPTLAAGWQAFDAGGNPGSAVFGTAQYMKDSLGFVHLRGLVRNISGSTQVGGSANSIIFNLPQSYRPGWQGPYVTVQNDTVGRIDIMPDGRVMIGGGAGLGVLNNTWLNLNGITFRAEV